MNEGKCATHEVHSLRIDSDIVCTKIIYFPCSTTTRNIQSSFRNTEGVRYIEYTNTNVNTIVTTLFPFAVEFILHFKHLAAWENWSRYESTNDKLTESEFSSGKERKWKAFCQIFHYDVKQKIFTSLSIIQSFNQQTDV